MHVSDAYVCEFRGRNSVKGGGGGGGECKTREKNSIFLKKGKTVISVENKKFFRSRMTKRIAPLNSSRDVTPLIPVRPDWRIRTGFEVRNHILGLLIYLFIFLFF